MGTKPEYLLQWSLEDKKTFLSKERLKCFVLSSYTSTNEKFDNVTTHLIAQSGVTTQSVSVHLTSTRNRHFAYIKGVDMFAFKQLQLS